MEKTLATLAVALLVGLLILGCTNSGPPPSAGGGAPGASPAPSSPAAGAAEPEAVNFPPDITEDANLNGSLDDLDAVANATG